MTFAGHVRCKHVLRMKLPVTAIAIAAALLGCGEVKKPADPQPDAPPAVEPDAPPGATRGKTTVVQTSGGGVTASAMYRARIRVGGPAH